MLTPERSCHDERGFLMDDVPTGFTINSNTNTLFMYVVSLYFTIEKCRKPERCTIKYESDATILVILEESRIQKHSTYTHE